MPKVRTHGLTHIALAVKDPQRSLEFYEQVFGVKEYYRDATTIQVQGPGPHDVLAFERSPASAGAPWRHHSLWVPTDAARRHRGGG